MKIVVFSDTHLTKIFEPKKYRFLKKIIESSDQVIINGDFWDCWYTDFDRFIHSKWQTLFPLLRDKKAIYIYGNHDPMVKCNHGINLFSIHANDRYSFSSSGQFFVVNHGADLIKGKRPWFEEAYYWILDRLNFNLIVKLFFWLIRLGEMITFKLFGLKIITKTAIAKNHNCLIKQLHQEGDKDWWIIGDTHLAEIDNQNRFLNTGCIMHGHASYAVIENGTVTLIKDRY